MRTGEERDCNPLAEFLAPRGAVRIRLSAEARAWVVAMNPKPRLLLPDPPVLLRPS